MNTLTDTPIKHVVFIKASRERVYDALTTSDIDNWFTTRSKIDARSGGEFRWFFENWGPEQTNGEINGPVLVAQRPERYVFQWHLAVGPSTVEFVMEEANEGTIIRLHESGYQDTSAGRLQLIDCAVGWGEALTLLKFYLEHGIGGKMSGSTSS